MIVNFFLTAALVYLALVAFLYFYQRNLLYFPDTVRPNPAEWGVSSYVPVEVQTSDNLTLNAWYFPSSDIKGPVVLFFHGNASHFASRAFKAPVFIEEGIGVLLAEYRGYGGNPGKPTEEGLYKDARSYIKWLEDHQDVKAEQIILYGESLGSGVAVQIATEYDVKAVILEAAFNSALEIAKQTYFFIPVGLLMKDQYRNNEKIGEMKAPVLFFHGDRDNTTSIKFSKKLFEAANEPKTFVTIPGAGHNDLYEFGAPLHIQEFLRNIAEQ